jgi:hypothetical protein
VLRAFARIPGLEAGPRPQEEGVNRASGRVFFVSHGPPTIPIAPYSYRGIIP